MNERPFKPCACPGCPELVRGGGYCPRHKSKGDSVKRSINIERRGSAAYHRLYDSVRWRRMRAAQLIASPFCAACAAVGLRVRATDVDHIRPHKGNRTLFYDCSNLQSLCHSCHSRKTLEERGRSQVQTKW